MVEKLTSLDELPPPTEPTRAEENALAQQMKADATKEGIQVRDPATVIQNLLVSRHQNRVPHLQEIIEAIIVEWGGPKEFAGSFHDTYINAKAGSAVRARMLEKCIDLMKINTQMFGEDDELDGLDDEQLMSFVQETFGADPAASQSEPDAPEGE